MRFTARLSTDDGAIWTAAAARSLIGQTPRLNARAHEGGPIVADYGTAIVVAAEVVEGGRAVLVTYETSAPLDMDTR